MDLISTLRRLATWDVEWDDKGGLFRQARERLTDQSALAERRASHARMVEQAADARARLASVELELASLQARLAQVEQELYGGAITAPRELENHRRDAEQTRAQLATLEDRGLELLTLSEQLDAEALADQHALAEFERQWDREIAQAQEVYRTNGARLRVLQAEREQLRATVPQRELALYDELRRTKAGRPLAPMAEGVCQVCHVIVPRNKVVMAESGHEAATCEGCGRILYPL
ncbi:MAG: zinc ribbon domain-containing protein [Anaerolineae bacterium]|jgi:predicted  nucleic acid-binding Zn-ribbon protein|nr:hypothetical protein [Chloroflexota bacterium]